MNLEEAIREICEGTGNAEVANSILFSTVSDIEEVAARRVIEADYLIESALEIAEQNQDACAAVIPQVMEYWLWIDAVDGAFPYEIVVRAAEFLAANLNDRPETNTELHRLAQSARWQERLVAGWAVRSRSDESAQKIKTKLSQDEFADDNGFYLVREAIGGDE